MSNQIAVGQCSTEEDLDIEWSFVSGYDPTGKAFEVNLRDRSSSTVRTTLTVGSGLTIVGAAVKAKVAKATMAAWPRTEYSADLVDKTGGAFKRVVPTRFIFDEPGKLVGGAGSNAFQITAAGNSFVITATRGETGPVGPATTLTIGTVSDLAAGNAPTATLTGPAGAQVLNLGLVRGTPGAGAANSADILAIGEKVRLERSLAAAGVPDEPSLILDFVRGVHFASKGAIAASIMTLIAALPGSSFTRASTGTFFDSDGLMKTAAAGVPRVEYDPVTLLPLGLLIEPARTNLFINSEAFVGIGGSAVTVSSNVSAGPDGLNTMDRIIENATSGEHFPVERAISLTAGTVYAYSIYVRAAPSANRSLRLRIASSTEVSVAFNPMTGTLSNPLGTGYLSSGFTNMGGGLYRVWIVFTAQATATSVARAQLLSGGASVYLGDGASGVDVGFAQLEVGNSPSSYIPTTASAVTRAADNYAIIPPAGLLSQTSGTILCEFSAHAPATSNSVPIRLDDQPTNLNGIYFGRNVDGSGACLCSVNGATVVATTASMPWPANGFARAAARYAPNDVTRSWSGAAVVSTTGFTAFSVITGFRSGQYAPGYVRRMMYFPTALADAKLVALSGTSWS